MDEPRQVVASFALPFEALQGVSPAFELPWEAEAVTAVGLVSAFVAMKPADAHPPHDHDNVVAVVTADFLALALVVSAVLRQLRRRAS